MPTTKTTTVTTTMPKTITITITTTKTTTITSSLLTHLNGFLADPSGHDPTEVSLFFPGEDDFHFNLTVILIILVIRIFFFPGDDIFRR